MRLLAYADEISVAPGDTIRFMVSCNPAGDYHAEVIRLICGDTNPAGPGFKAEPVADLGRHAGRPQRIDIGSRVVVPDHPAFRDLDSFTVAVLAWPTLPGAGEQTLIARYDGGHGFALVLDADGRPAVLIDGTLLAAAEPLVRRRWHLVAASIGDGEVRIVQQALGRAPAVTRHARPGPSPVQAPLTVAARGAGTHYNGKLEAPTLWRGTLVPEAVLERMASPDGDDLVCRLDFAQGIQDTAVYDVSGHRMVGETVNLPMRAATGHLWTGEEMCWHRRPEHYAAIHFHDDDLHDAGWEPCLDWAVPEEARSGVYALRLSAGEDEAFVPFAVRAAQPGSQSRVAMLLPTASYLAYANDHCHLEGANPQLLGHRLVELQPADLYLAAHPELGCSLYDRHRDGSGSAYSSRLRPIPNLSPKHVWWIGGPGSGVWQLSADLHITDWLEAIGQDYEVVTDEDLHERGLACLEPYRVVLTGTHPEYTSTRMWDALQAYIEGGGRLMYLGGNGFYWRIAFHERLPGVIEVRRAEDGTRSWASEPGEYHNAFDGTYGGLWRRNGRPPQALVGVGFTAQGFGRSGYYLRTEASRDPRVAFVFEGVEGERIGDSGLVGGGAAGLELDRADHELGTPENALVVLTSTGHEDHVILANEEILVNRPNVTGDQSPLIRSDVVFLANPAGGAVFSVGSIAWCGSLAVDAYRGEVARITANVLARFLDDEGFDGS